MSRKMLNETTTRSGALPGAECAAEPASSRNSIVGNSPIPRPSMLCHILCDF
jgi:hypothetical protein